MTQNMNEVIPLVCDLTAMDAAQKDRGQILQRQIVEAVESFTELDNGYAIRFPGDSEMFMALAEFATLERLCCPFIDFSLELDAGGGATWLQLTGPTGVKDFLRAELGLA